MLLAIVASLVPALCGISKRGVLPTYRGALLRQVRLVHNDT